VPPPPVAGGAVGNWLVGDCLGDGLGVRFGVRLGVRLGVRSAGAGDSLTGEAVARCVAALLSPPGDPDGRVDPPAPLFGVLVGVPVEVADGVDTMTVEPETLSDGPAMGVDPGVVDAEEPEHPAAKASTMTTNAQSRSLPIAHRLRE
jgi:hypothetical protein